MCVALTVGSITKFVFVPFLGDFLSMETLKIMDDEHMVFVPFLGDFLSITHNHKRHHEKAW